MGGARPPSKSKVAERSARSRQPSAAAKIRSMEPESGRRSGFSLRGSAGLIIAVAVLAILLIAFPAYRWFFLISVLIGLVIAGGLALWHRLHPIEEQDVEPKRPLGL